MRVDTAQRAIARPASASTAIGTLCTNPLPRRACQCHRRTSSAPGTGAATGPKDGSPCSCHVGLCKRICPRHHVRSWRRSKDARSSIRSMSPGPVPLCGDRTSELRQAHQPAHGCVVRSWPAFRPKWHAGSQELSSYRWKTLRHWKAAWKLLKETGGPSNVQVALLAPHAYLDFVYRHGMLEPFTDSGIPTLKIY